jgi:hypothetical protein
MNTHDDIVYLAAIIDGEGSLAIDIQNPIKDDRKTDYYSIRIIIVNTSLDLMNWLESKFGGKVHKRKLIKGRKQCYQWRIYSFNASKLLQECLPYMIIKKQHAQIIIDFMHTKKDGWLVTFEVQEVRRLLYKKIKEINKLGT